MNHFEYRNVLEQKTRSPKYDLDLLLTKTKDGEELFFIRGLDKPKSLLRFLLATFVVPKCDIDALLDNTSEN